MKLCSCPTVTHGTPPVMRDKAVQILQLGLFMYILSLYIDINNQIFHEQ